MMIKNWVMYNESVVADMYYHYDGTDIYVDRIEPWGSDYRLSVVYPDGKRTSIIVDKNDLNTDFTTGQPFKILRTAPLVKKPKPQPMCNLVYSNGRNSLILRRNIPQKLAYALRGTFMKDPQYKGGELIVEII